MLSSGEYVLADADFQTSTHVLALFEREETDKQITGRNAYFNHIAIPTRTIPEQALDILSSRWRILKHARVSTRVDTDDDFMNLVVDACIVLHNMLLDTGDIYVVIDTDSDSVSRPSWDAAGKGLEKGITTCGKHSEYDMGDAINKNDAEAEALYDRALEAHRESLPKRREESRYPQGRGYKRELILPETYDPKRYKVPEGTPDSSRRHQHLISEMVLNEASGFDAKGLVI
ncbi:hypothetical protein L198_04546 [Cryptococcus wingfieldii CBS 7118]|uniref:DDE Tnp4 domain-containing protein n=1 Tax=Cryptococcus wingfieldii CBS 7118 TaxID=1295528 RepID=A0A1E3J512_9TREE|nr:hypothetical protein L198_04546 [Cryptococcus wingfieldii CBS 7118]ODN95927.1 hypothetical protein L198_04546 [Cryptococcus wingfieldii CBS 7118]